ncbi:unnamed protein product [Rhizopus stolonifer]
MGELYPLKNFLSSFYRKELGILAFSINWKNLPKESQAYFPFAVVETNLGIPQTTLAQTIKETHELYITLSKDDYKRMNQVTRIMIVLKPDNYTAMNRRKELILHSKSSVAWYHRQWILSQYENIVKVEAELRLCERACSAYKRNYYAWTYRSWILARHVERAESEYNSVIGWIELNISDASGFQYLEQTMKLREWNKLLTETHIKWLDGLIIKYPGYESLWCHKRYCVYKFDTQAYLQHQFVQDVIQDKYNNQALDNENLKTQKEFALKFGLWLAVLENRRHRNSTIDSSWIDSYRSVAPEPKFLDRQGKWS